MFNKIKIFLKTDSFLVGIIVGIVLPVILYTVLHYIVAAFPNPKTNNPFIKESTIQILGIAINAISLRYFLINRKADKAGRGIMLITFIMAILFFVFNLTN
jgi:uncharacterized membrane protein YozB (DUF420 family)